MDLRNQIDSGMEMKEGPRGVLFSNWIDSRYKRHWRRS